MSTFTGTGRGDVFAGSAADDHLRGEGGKDSLSGGAGRDVMYGGGGDDKMSGEAGDDVMVGSNGKSAAVDLSNFKVTEATKATVTFNYEEAGFQNTLGAYKIGADGKIYDVQLLFANASLKGSGGDLVAGKSTASLDLKPGDKLGFFVVPNAFAQLGMDKLLGDKNAAWKMVERGSGKDGNINGGPVDLVHVAKTGKETVIKSQYGSDLFHSVSGASGKLNADKFQHVKGEVDVTTGKVKIGFEDLWKGGDKDFDDQMFTIDIGTTNAETLDRVGSKLSKYTDNDAMSGGSGNDTMFGFAGDDFMDGGADADKLYGGSGNDVLTGGDGNDQLYGGSGNDRILGDEGNDYIVGGSGFDTLDFSGVGRAVQVDLNKHVANGAGHDSIWGVEGVVGSRFGDVLDGDKRGNALDGGAGDDVLRGRGGADSLTGGDGRDTFVWHAKDLGSGVDHVTDFGKGDVLDLSHVFKGKVGADAVQLRDTKEGTVLAAKVGDAFVDVAVLDGVHGLNASEMLAHGALLV
jgi:Ca2+-binding RTX toxin-like protein